jgi:hypothetical protein
LEAHVLPIPNNPVRAFFRNLVMDFLLMWPIHQAQFITRLRAWSSRLDWPAIRIIVLCVGMVLSWGAMVVSLGAELRYPFFVRLAYFLGLPVDL